MKKLLFVGILMFSIIVTGCDNEKKEEKLEQNISQTIELDNTSEAKLICTNDASYEDLNYSVGAKYAFFADEDDKVTKIVSQEIISSPDKDTLEEALAYFNDSHQIPLKYEGYEAKVTKKENRVISATTIDYTKFNIEKYIGDNDVSANFTTNDDLKLNAVESLYVTLGSVCEKK